MARKPRGSRCATSASIGTCCVRLPESADPTFGEHQIDPIIPNRGLGAVQDIEFMTFHIDLEHLEPWHSESAQLLVDRSHRHFDRRAVTLPLRPRHPRRSERTCGGPPGPSWPSRISGSARPGAATPEDERPGDAERSTGRARSNADRHSEAIDARRVPSARDSPPPRRTPRSGGRADVPSRGGASGCRATDPCPSAIGFAEAGATSRGEASSEATRDSIESSREETPPRILVVAYQQYVRPRRGRCSSEHAL